MVNAKGDRAQSSMEYMMSYGWAAIVITIVLVLLFVYFGSSSTLPFANAGCVPTTGYSCTTPILNSSGYLAMALSHSGSTYAITGFGCQASGSNTTLELTPLNGSIVVPAGQAVTALFKCQVGPIGSVSSPIGTPFTGKLFITYNTTTATNVTDQIGLVQTKVATGSSLTGSVAESGLSIGSATVPSLDHYVNFNDAQSASIATSQSNEIIVVAIAGYNSGCYNCVSATVDGNTMTLQNSGTYTYPGGIALFIYTAPSPGMHSISVSSSYYCFTCGLAETAMSFKHVTATGISNIGTAFGSTTSYSTNIGVSTANSIVVFGNNWVYCTYNSDNVFFGGIPATPTKLNGDFYYSGCYSSQDSAIGYALEPQGTASLSFSNPNYGLYDDYVGVILPPS